MTPPCRVSLPLLYAVSAYWVLGAAPAVAAPAPLHAFDFDGGYLDSVSGTVTITPEGGTLGGGLYQFNPQTPDPNDLPAVQGVHNEGLTLQAGLSDPGVYSFEMYVKLDQLRSIAGHHWLKLVDFKNGVINYGMFAEDQVWDLEPSANPGEQSVLTFAYDADGNSVGPPATAKDVNGAQLAPNQWRHIVGTRDSSNQFTAYLDGQFAYSFTDTHGYAVFDGAGNPDNLMRFFQGDTQYQPAYLESPRGAIDFLNVYDTAISASDAATLYAAVVPEPSASLLAAGLGLTPALRRRRRAA